MSKRYIKNVRMVKYLIQTPGGSLSRYALAKAAKSSQPWGVKFIQNLEEKGLVSGTRVVDVLKLARYGVEISPSPEKVIRAYHGNPLEFIKRNLKEYALTTYFAENLITHHLFPSRCDIYVKQDVLEDLFKKVMDEGMIGDGNLRFIVPADPEIVRDIQLVNEIMVVSMGQLIMDLIKEGGVCTEAAEEMVKRNVWKERNRHIT